MNTIQNVVLFTKDNGEKFVKFEIGTKTFVAKVEGDNENFSVVFFLKEKRQVAFTLKKLEQASDVKVLSGLTTINIPVKCSKTRRANFYAKTTNSIYFVLNASKTEVLKRVKHKEFESCAKNTFTNFNLPFEVFVEVFTPTPAAVLQ